MSCTKFLGTIIKQPLVQKIVNIIYASIEKKIINMQSKNITLFIQLRKRNIPFAKNYLLNILKYTTDSNFFS